MNTNYNITLKITAWLCLSIFYFYQYVLRMLPNIIMPEILQKFCIGASEFGNFAGIYYIGYIIAHIPIGVLLSRFGNKIVLSVCVLISAVGLLPFSYFDSWSYMILGRFLIGVGSSAAAIGAIQVFRVLFPNAFSRAIGLMVCVGLLTTVFCSGPISYFIDMLGVDYVINAIVVAGMALAVFTFIVIPNTSQDTSSNENESHNVWYDVKSVLCNFKVISISILAGLMVGPLEGFADAWGNAFIVSVFELSKAEANSIVFCILTGMCFGCIILPYFADKTRRYYEVTFISAVLMLISYIIMMLDTNSSTQMLKLICFVIGIFSAYQTVIIPKASMLVPENLSAMAAAITNMIIMSFGSVFHNSIGYVLQKMHNGKIENGIVVYSKDAYMYSISVIPIAIAISAVGFFIVIILNYNKKYY
ncbi:MAG: MFS transporter [Rickettsiaceae bacterium]